MQQVGAFQMALSPQAKSTQTKIILLFCDKIIPINCWQQKQFTSQLSPHLQCLDSITKEVKEAITSDAKKALWKIKTIQYSG